MSSLLRDPRAWQLLSALLLLALLARECGPAAVTIEPTPTATHAVPATIGAQIVTPVVYVPMPYPVNFTPAPTPTFAGPVVLVCWSTQSTTLRTVIPGGRPPFFGTRVPMRTAVMFPCDALPAPSFWSTYTGTGIDQGNHGLLERHPLVNAPVLTFRFPPTWKLQEISTGYGGGNQAGLNFALYKHEQGIAESKGETPAVSDAFFQFALVLDGRSPWDFSDTTPLGFGAMGTIIEHGTFNKYLAMFASIGDAPNGIQRHVLFQLAPGVLVLVSAEFPLMNGASPEYIRQTLDEMEVILASVGAEGLMPSVTPSPAVHTPAAGTK